MFCLSSGNIYNSILASFLYHTCRHLPCTCRAHLRVLLRHPNTPCIHLVLSISIRWLETGIETGHGIAPAPDFTVMVSNTAYISVHSVSALSSFIQRLRLELQRGHPRWGIVVRFQRLCCPLYSLVWHVHKYYTADVISLRTLHTSSPRLHLQTKFRMICLTTEWKTCAPTIYRGQC